MIKTTITYFIFNFFVFLSYGQLIDPSHHTYAFNFIHVFASDSMYGRGYVHNGHIKASDYLAGEFEKQGIQKFNGERFQDFKINVNCFPEKPILKVNGHELHPGYDYLPGPESGPADIHHSSVVYVKPYKLDASSYREKLTSQAKEHVIMFDMTVATDSGISSWEKHRDVILDRGKGYIETDKRLIFHIRENQRTYPYFILPESSSYIDKVSHVNYSIKPEFKKELTTRNVLGYIPGTEKPDSFIVVTAHYDHLGSIGVHPVFTGANDNASGVAMILSLGKYFAKNPLRYSVLLIAFSGEELGLKGSLHFVKNSPIDLKKIKFLVNFDIVGTGSDGIKVVNGKENWDQFNQLEALNDKHKLLKEVGIRGAASNSDHHPFHEAGVPCFYVYTLGGVKAYHDVYDRPETLPLTAFQELKTLMIRFFEEITWGN